MLLLRQWDSRAATGALTLPLPSAVTLTAIMVGQVSPGCGCDTDLVDEIVAELKARQSGRGDTGQIKRAEQTLQRLDELESKLDKIMDHLKIERS